MSLVGEDMTNPPFGLLRLPLEVVQNVLNVVEDKQDLYRLLNACPKLYNFILPTIWESIIFKIRNEKKVNAVDATNVNRLLRARSETFNRLQFVKELVVEGTSPPQKWCIHQSRIYQSYFRDMGADLLLFLGHLEENSLKHFIWNTGTCVPNQILGIHGYLPAKQRNLETLKLVVNQLCAKSSPLHLAPFGKLKYFSLEGARDSQDGYTVREMLKLSRRTIIELELNILPEEFANLFSTYWSLYKIVPLSGVEGVPVTDGPLFPKLRVLLLSSISFQNCAAEFVATVDLTSLTSLTIRQCLGWANVVQLMCLTEKLMCLRWLELAYEQADRRDLSNVVDLLHRCPKLENLSICHGGSMCHLTTFKIWKAACARKPHLRGFVFHMYDFSESSDYLTPVSDPRNAGHEDKLELLLAISACVAVPQMNPFSDVDLDFLGVCCFPNETLQAILLPFRFNKCLRVLHIRKSAGDMTGSAPFIRAVDGFARWVFGDNGISSLGCLLFGDFSAKRLRKGINCRYNRTTTTPYFKATVEPEIGDLRQRHRSLIMACPTQFRF